MSTAQLSPGTIVDGRFTIGAAAWAREGAQSYAATDAQQGRPVVLTAYAPACFSSGLVLERSLRELRQLQTLQSPRIATVIACGKLPDGGIYEAVSALPDTRLDALVARGALPGPQAATTIEQVGEGLLEAQKAGVIHRNLGPRVVFVGPEGAVVTGFSVGEPHSDRSFGPLDTIAPEQVEGKVVDQRTLIYNLAALMHMLITGAPLFAGDAATQLQAHLSGEIPADVNARLRRALGKDPRMRPMMLKQFLAELRAIGGGVARAPMAPSTGGEHAPPLPGGNLSTPGAEAKPASPTSRGWTMFMQGEASAAPGGPGAGAPAAAAPAVAATAAAPAKPKTRGWTMFMEGADEPAQKPEDKPAAKPSTRGWTMFMEDEEGQAPASEGESPIAQAVAPAPASEPAGAQPKTRGWTMFMEDEEGQAASEPAQATVVAPAPGPTPMPAVAPPVAGGPAVKPSTRGWTMFMKDDEQAEAVAIAQPAAQAPDEPETKIFAASPAAVAPPPVAPPPAAAPVASASTPKSRGWTMFTEASDDEATQAVAMATPLETPPAPASAPLEVAAPPAEMVASSAEPSAASSSTAMGRRGNDSDAPSKKRGWTMFMESPLDKGKDPLGGVVPSSGESNAKGWTVFSPAADTGAQPAADPALVGMDAPAAPPSMSEAAPAAYEQELAPARDVASQTAAGQTSYEVDEIAALAQQAAEDDRMRARTVVVTGPPDPALANNRLKTMVAAHSPAAPPHMVTVMQPEPPTEGMSGAVSGPISTGLSGPISTGISGPISTGMSGPASSSMPVHAGSHAMEPAAKKGSPVVLIVVGLVLVAAAIGAAYVLLT